MRKKSELGGTMAHDFSQTRYPLPGTDLGRVNAEPAEFVPDVDLSTCRHTEDTCTCGHKGRHSEWVDGHEGHMGQHSFAVPRIGKKFGE
jgi:hypothetical protein